MKILTELQEKQRANGKKFSSNIQSFLDTPFTLEKLDHTVKVFLGFSGISFLALIILGSILPPKIMNILVGLVGLGMLILLVTIFSLPLLWILYELMKQRNSALISGRKMNITIWCINQMIDYVFLNPFALGASVIIVNLILGAVAHEFFGDGAYLIVFIVLSISMYTSFFMRKWFKKQRQKLYSFFEEVESYQSLKLIENSDSPDSILSNTSIQNILEETEELHRRTEALIEKRKYARFVFTTPSYESYKQMIHDRIKEMIPFLEKQKVRLLEKVEEKRQVLVETREEAEKVMKPIPSLQYTAEVQRARLDKQIEGFGRLRQQLR